MNNSHPQFETIAQKMTAADEQIALGKMMSAPGLTFKGKVFAFYWNDAMIFKLGKTFDADGAQLEEWSYLHPFKNKGPMKAWFVIPESQQDRWPELAERALQNLQMEIK